MIETLRNLVREKGLEAGLPVFEKYARPAVGFVVKPGLASEIGSSRLGDGADVPEGFVWPLHKGRPLDFLLQVNLADLAPPEGPWHLPREGTLAFFYDLDEQPWGFDPAEQTGARIAYFEPGTVLRRVPPTPAECPLESARLEFYPMLTLPLSGSLYGEPMWVEATELGALEDEDEDLACDLAAAYHPTAGTTQHRLGGYPWEIQNPMEDEAQLVTHGINCGDSKAYADPRVEALRKGVHDWRLVLQLDSDEAGGFMWGDVGMLYFWNRFADTERRSFDGSWMTLQCS